MAKKRERCDRSSPESRKLIDEIVHGTFVKEGTMVALPTCFPGVTVQIPIDESRITALDVTPDGIVYGGTSGARTHLFVGMLHGITGIVFDMGAVDGANHCAAMCCCGSKFVACVNGPDGGRLIARKLQGLPFDLLQEWGFGRPPLDDLGQPVAGERIVHAVADLTRERVTGVTEQHLFAVDVAESKVSVVGEIAGRGRLAVGSRGGVFGPSGERGLWRFDPETGQLSPAAELPSGRWADEGTAWARDNRSGLLYTAEADGRLFSFSEEDGFSGELGRTRLSPVGPMAVTHDGRVFGFCGSEISRMFCYDPSDGKLADIGVAASVFQRRRYGYVFGDAVTGRDGEIVFGENDNAGHLWLYFPRIK